MTADDLAEYIIRGWLRIRNKAQLEPAIAAMTVQDYELMQEELALILKNNGHPPNWTSPPDDTTITLPDGRVLGNHTEELKELCAWQTMANQTGAIDERSGRKTRPEDVMSLVTTLRSWLASERQHTASLIKTNDGLQKTIEGLHGVIATIKKRYRTKR